MVVIGFVVGFLYCIICTILIVVKSAFDKRRSTGQRIVLALLNIAILLFCFWVYSWSHNTTLLVECLFGISIVLNPIALIFMPIKDE